MISFYSIKVRQSDLSQGLIKVFDAGLYGKINFAKENIDKDFDEIP